MPTAETIIQFLEWLEPTLALLIRFFGWGFVLVSLIYYFMGLVEEAQYWAMLCVAMFLVLQG